MKMSLTFSEISPYVRWVRVCNEPYFSTHAFPYDNRLFYCTEGCGEIVIEKKAYKIEKDTMILWRGGQEYLYIPPVYDTWSRQQGEFKFIIFGNTPWNTLAVGRI